MAAWRVCRNCNGHSGPPPARGIRVNASRWRPSAGAWVNGRAWTNLSDCRTICDEHQLNCCNSCDMREDLQEPPSMRVFFVLLVLALVPSSVVAATAARDAQSALAADRPTALSPNTTYDPK